MAETAHLPELIISLSRDKVEFRLLGNKQLQREAWSASFPIDAMFVEDQLSHVFDQALSQNPALVDHFNRVEVVITDQPHVTMPAHYEEDGQWSNIAGRYLRKRSGDTMVAESLSEEALLVYNLPVGATRLIREYYANAGRVHLTAVLWLAIQQHLKALPDPGLRLFYVLHDNALIVLGASAGNLTFTKTCFVAKSTDLNYYITACSRMMQPAENWAVTLKDEILQLNLSDVSEIKFHDTLALADMQELIASHSSCAL